MKILIDNGHGAETKGKRSPVLEDGSRLYEYAYARKVAKEIVSRLKKEGYDADLLTPEENDVKITTRANRANIECTKHASKNVLLVSIHLNAVGSDDKWHDARGWQVCVSLNASSRSKTLATCLLTTATGLGLKTRVPAPNKAYWEQNLGICRQSWCPAVLTENLFQDNKDDVKYLMSAEGFDKIVKLHVEGIKNYIRLT